MRYYNQINNNDQFNRLYGAAESGLGYAAWPYFGSSNKYGPNPFMSPAFAARSSLAYSPLPEYYNHETTMRQSFGVRGPLPGALKVTFGGIQNITNPLDNSGCIQCNSFNHEFILYNGLTYSNTTNFYNNIHLCSQASVFAHLVDGPTLIAQQDAHRLGTFIDVVISPAVENYIFESGKTYLVAGMTAWWPLFLSPGNVRYLTFFAQEVGTYSKISDAFSSFYAPHQPSGAKMLETKFIINSGSADNNYCDLSNATVTVEPVKDDFYDYKSTLMGFNRFEEKQSISNIAFSVAVQNTTAKSLFCNDYINHYTSSYDTTDSIEARSYDLNINTFTPSVFKLQITNIDSSGSLNIHTINPEEYYSYDKQLILSSRYLRTIPYTESSRLVLSESQLFNTVPSGTFTKVTVDRYETQEVPNGNEYQGVSTTFPFLDFYNISDLGCAKSINDYYIGTEGQICNNKTILDIAQFYPNETGSPVRVDAFLLFGEYTNPSGFYFHNFYFRKTICDDLTTNRCSEPFYNTRPITTHNLGTMTTSIAKNETPSLSGLVTCYNSGTWSDGWTYHSWSPNRPNTKYFSESSLTNIGDFSNANIRLVPNKYNQERMRAPCYICYCSGLARTAILEVTEPGYTSNGPYAYDYIGAGETINVVELYANGGAGSDCAYRYNDYVICADGGYGPSLISTSGTTIDSWFTPGNGAFLTREITSRYRSLIDCIKCGDEWQIELSGRYATGLVQYYGGDVYSGTTWIRFKLTFEDIIYEYM